MRNTMTELPSRLEEQIFIKQLIDVDDISYDDVDDIVLYTKEKFDYINSVRTAINKDEVSDEEVKNIRADVVSFWHQV